MPGDAIRRPAQTPPLGVPDLEWPRAIAVMALNMLGNKKWVSVTPQAISNVPTIVATLTIKALGTGRFRTRATGYVVNGVEAAHSILVGVSEGVANAVADYVPVAPLEVLVPTVATAGTATIAQIVSFPDLAPPKVFAVGGTYDFNLIMSADAAASVAIGTNTVQFEVEEY